MTPDKEALISRLESAEVGSRELDGLIEDHLGEWINLGGWWREHKITGERESYTYVPPPRYTTSIDAALALVERVLGAGQEYEITTLYGVARVSLNLNHGDDGGPYYGSHECGNVALAICLALLKAKGQDHE